MTTTKRTIKTLAVMSTVVLMGACSQEQVEQMDPLTDKESEGWAESLSSVIQTSEMSVGVALTELDDMKDLVTAEAFNDVAETLIYTLYAEQDRYNEMLFMMEPEISQVLRLKPDLSFEEEDGWDDVEFGLVKGLMEEVKNLPLEWEDTDESISLVVDHASFLSDFEEYLSPLMVNKITFIEDQRANDEYDRDMGIVNFEHVFDRLELLDTFKTQDGEDNWDMTLDSQYYYHSLMAYGFGEASMNYATGEYNADALEAMRAVAKERAGHQVADNMTKIADLIEKEGAYNEAVMEKVNAIINDQFKDYLQAIEDEVKEEEEKESKKDEDASKDIDSEDDSKEETD